MAINGTSRKEYEEKLHQTLGHMFYLTIPPTFFLFFLAEPLVRLFFERGAFDSKATALTSFVLKMYVIGLFAHAISPVLVRIFYSFKNTVTPLIISAVCIVLNIILNIVLSKFLGASGIALATSIVMTLNIFLYSWFLRRYLITFSRSLKSVIFKVLICSLPIGIICYLSLSLFDQISANSIPDFINLSLRVSLVGLISLIPFLLLSSLLRLEPFEFIKSYFISFLTAFKK